MLFLDETGTIKIENQQEMARYEAFEEKSRRVSPEPNQVMSPVHDDHFEKMEEHQSFIPNTRDSLNNIKFGNFYIQLINRKRHFTSEGFLQCKKN